MKAENIWERAKALNIRVSGDITDGFSLGFDERIPKQTRDALISFAYWVEDNFFMPITLWVDFKYNHYLLDSERKRTGYRFYWAEFKECPCFDEPDDIPVIELAVNCSVEKILPAFIEAITCYFIWLAGESCKEFTPDPDLTESILQKYLQEKC